MHNNININVSGPVQPSSQYKTVVLKGNLPLAQQLTEPNTKYVVKHDFEIGMNEIYGNLDFGEASMTIDGVAYHWLIFEAGKDDTYTLTDDTCVFIENSHDIIVPSRGIHLPQGGQIRIGSTIEGLHQKAYKFHYNGIQIPENVILEFDGGSIDHGTLFGNDTTVFYMTSIEDVLKSTQLEGTWHYNNFQLDKLDNTNGMARIYLKPNQAFGDQLIKENTIYIIQHDFDLEDTEVTIPANCVLEFDGGSVNNGTLILGTTKCFGVNGLKCKITSDYPVRTSLCGIGTEYEEDSAQRLSDLVNNNVKIIVDTNITCLSPIVSNKKPFYFVGDYSQGYRRPAYTISFPNSDGFVLTSGQDEPTTNITVGHTFRNLNIISDGTCINFWPENHIAVFAENTFENLYLDSANGDCINFGENYTPVYATSGFNQYFRQIEAKALNGACFRNIRANCLRWEHITIYGSKDGGFYNCTGSYHNIIFDQSQQKDYGWRWVGKALSGVNILIENGHFENMKCPISADGTFNGSFVFLGFYADCGGGYDDPDDGKKHYNHISFGNATSIYILGAFSYNLTGGDFASGYSMFYNALPPRVLGNGSLSILIHSNKVVNVDGVGIKDIIRADYTQAEDGKFYMPALGRMKFENILADIFALTPVEDSALEFYSTSIIKTSGSLTKSILVKTSRTIDGYQGYHAPYQVSVNKVFEFDIINKSSGDVTLVHRSSKFGTTYQFNSFTGANVVLKNGQSAHCRFNSAQVKGDVVANMYQVDIVSISPLEPVSGDTRPTNPYIGQQFFDTTSGIEKPIWYKGNNEWVDATGATV